MMFFRRKQSSLDNREAVLAKRVQSQRQVMENARRALAEQVEELTRSLLDGEPPDEKGSDSG